MGHRLLLISSLAVLILSLSTVLFIPAVLSSEYTTSTIEVVICFTDVPDLQLLYEYEVTVFETYSVIPAVYASVPLKCVGLLEQNPSIAYITENSQIQVSGEIDWPFELINAPTAWAESIGEGIKVAVLDTGIAPINDLKVYGGYNFVERNVDTVDRNGHGTMIASIIAIQPTSSTGLIGVAPGVELYAVKTLNNRGEGTMNQALLGVQWAIDNGMHIISMSWGSNTNNSALRQALDVAYDKGILIVAAAGNSGETNPGVVEYPARYNTTIAVAAVKADGSRLEMSCFGPEIELAAPGGNVCGVGPNNIIYRGNGTSLAVPYVVGTAALVWAKNTSLTNIEVRNILCQTATKTQIDNKDIARDIYYGYGIVNAAAAVQATQNNNNSTTNKLTPTDYQTNTPNNNSNNNNNNQQPSRPASTETNTPTTTINQQSNIPNNINNINKDHNNHQPDLSTSTSDQQTNTPTTPLSDNINTIIIASIMSILVIIDIITLSTTLTYRKQKNNSTNTP